MPGLTLLAALSAAHEGSHTPSALALPLPSAARVCYTEVRLWQSRVRKDSVLSDRTAIVERRDLAAKVLACSLLTALGARLAMPLPYTPVPVTWQVAGVLLAGLWLGPRGAFASQTLYVLMGAAGAPVFAHGFGGAAVLIGPTGGYLLSYPFAAWAVGTLAGMQPNRGPIRMFLASMAAVAVIYAFGCLQLAFVLHLSPLQALLRGAGAFLLWDVAKAVLVVGAIGLKDRSRYPLRDERL